MAVTNQKSDQITNVEASPPVLEETHTLEGGHRIAFFSHTQVGAGDANSDIELVQLPAGKLRLLTQLSLVEHNWTVATVDMNVGFAAHTDQDGSAVVADPNGLDAAIDVEVAGTFTPGSALAAGTGLTQVFSTQSGVTLTAQAIAAGLNDGDTVQGYFVYVLD